MKVWMVYEFYGDDELTWFSPSFFKSAEEAKKYILEEHNLGEVVENWQVMEIDLSLGHRIDVRVECVFEPPF